MPEVLVHPLVSLRSTPLPILQHISNPLKRGLSPFFVAYIICVICSSATCAAQTLINGQTHTNGLAIIDAPYPNSEQHVGSTMPISIELSGNGKLPFDAFRPGSGLATHYELLEIYLVSSATGLNLTISSGTGLLVGETGTVRHHDVTLPSCVPAGQYNLTFYESSFINSIPYFIITPIPISISNNGGSGSSCSEEINRLEVQPQPDSNFGQSPFVPSQQIVVSTSGLDLGAAATQTRPRESDVRTTIPIATTTSSHAGTPTPISQPTGSSKPSASVTLVIVSQVVTTIANAQNEPITTSYMTTRTTAVPMNTAMNAGVIPINAGTAHLDHLTCIFIPLLITLWAITLTLKLE